MKCPGGKCLWVICPWGKCIGGTCPGELCPRTIFPRIRSQGGKGGGGVTDSLKVATYCQTTSQAF